MQKVLITGVYGLIAAAIYQRFVQLTDRYDVYAVARRRVLSERAPQGLVLDIADDRFFLADLSDFDAVRRSVEGMDVVVQMAADPRPHASWEQILSSNVIGVYNVFEACRQAGVRRIVLASSVMASWGYQADEPYRAIKEGRFGDVPDRIPEVTHLDPPRPTEPYSASKVWGEALARVYSDVHGLSCICLRIGAVNAPDRPANLALCSVWSSQRDVVQLVERCVDAPDALRFDIFYGISNNRHRWVDIAHAREGVGYVPQDRAEDYPL
jgi:nucleoside-diphosphate-sugar epimerase